MILFGANKMQTIEAFSPFSFLVFISGYDKEDLPSYDRVTEVKMKMFVKDLYGLSENTMDFSAQCYFRLEWLDERLKVRQFTVWP